MLVERGLQLGFGPGVELLEEDDADAEVLALFALDAEVVADLSAADEQAARVFDVVVGQDILEALDLPKSASVEDASGWRSMLFGVKTTSGLRHETQRLTTQEMEVLRGVRGLADLAMLSLAASWR